jgi:2-keto-4-pentenoate hydratase
MAVDVGALAMRLLEAEATRQPVPPLTEQYANLTPHDAYQVQLALIERKLAQGARVIGRKIGLTSKAMQRMLNVDQPDYGHLLDRMAVRDGGAVEVARLIQPKAEPEIAFIMGRDLRGPGVTAEQVLEATKGVVPALEIIDSRIENWKIKLCDTIADNASSALFVVGDRPVPVEGFDLRLVGMVLEKNGEIVNTGAGAAILGHPLNAVVWLVNKLAEFDAGVREGDVVLPGALTAATDVAAGDAVTATFDRIGSVSVRFI